MPSSGVHAFGWNPDKGQLDPRALDGVEQVLHLAGAPVAQRWSPAARAQIRTSRIDALEQLRAACLERGMAPRIISASAIGFYGPSAEWRTETDDGGSGFLAEVVRDWETAARRFGDLGGGHVIARIGLVLAAEGGVLDRLLPIYRLGLGAPLASGEQWQSWIHIEDLARLFHSALHSTQWTGTYNAVSPQPAQQRDFSKALANAVHRPHFFPNVPAWALRLRFGEAAEALLSSHRIRSTRLVDVGFELQHPALRAALGDILL
jgi:uncharacterized protein